MVETARQNQVLQAGLPAVRPMLDVMGIAVARFAAGKLALAAVPAEQGAAHGARHGAGAAPDIQNLTIGGVAQHHDAGIAGHAAGRLPTQVEPARLLDDGLSRRPGLFPEPPVQKPLR